MNRFIIITLLFALTTGLQARITQTELLNTTINQYQKAEWNVSLEANWNNPYAFAEIALDMVLTSPSGKQLTLPCYYDSGKSGSKSVWKAHFTPREADF